MMYQYRIVERKRIERVMVWSNVFLDWMAANHPMVEIEDADSNYSVLFSNHIDLFYEANNEYLKTAKFVEKIYYSLERKSIMQPWWTFTGFANDSLSDLKETINEKIERYNATKACADHKVVVDTFSSELKLFNYYGGM